MDFNTLMAQRSGWIFGFVLLLAFVLLLVSFRSLVIPVTSVVLNLLSVGAAYGVVVALFQWGWGQSLFGFTSTHSIASWLPLFLFLVLFGLSMDYMKLLGRYNWYLPRWLRWLPQVSSSTPPPTAGRPPGGRSRWLRG